MSSVKEEVKQDIKALEKEIDLINLDLILVKSQNKPKETIDAIEKLLKTKEQLLQSYKQQKQTNKE